MGNSRPPNIIYYGDGSLTGFVKDTGAKWEVPYQYHKMEDYGGHAGGTFAVGIGDFNGDGHVSVTESACSSIHRYTLPPSLPCQAMVPCDTIVRPFDIVVAL